MSQILIYELMRWSAYRSIKHPTMVWYVWRLPIALAVILALLYFLIFGRSGLTTDTEIVEKTSAIIGLLPGFFIAALAAVATFDRPEMDEEMPAPAPKVTIFARGQQVEINLTRRLFLSYLFSYLSILSLLIVLICATIVPTLLGAKSFLSSVLYRDIGSCLLFVEIVAFTGLAYVCSSLFFTTLHGAYFLTERIHQPN